MDINHAPTKNLHDMTPRLTRHYSRDSWYPHSILSRKICKCCACNSFKSYLPNLLFGKFRLPAFFSALLTTCANHIVNIVLIGARNYMQRVPAKGNIAGMATHWQRPIAVTQKECQAMNLNVASPIRELSREWGTNRDVTVGRLSLALIDRVRPQPALIVVVAVHLLSNPIVKRFLGEFVAPVENGFSGKLPFGHRVLLRLRCSGPSVAQTAEGLRIWSIA